MARRSRLDDDDDYEDDEEEEEDEEDERPRRRGARARDEEEDEEDDVEEEDEDERELRKRAETFRLYKGVATTVKVYAIMMRGWVFSLGALAVCLVAAWVLVLFLNPVDFLFVFQAIGYVAMFAMLGLWPGVNIEGIVVGALGIAAPKKPGGKELMIGKIAAHSCGLLFPLLAFVVADFAIGAFMTLEGFVAAGYLILILMILSWAATLVGLCLMLMYLSNLARYVGEKKKAKEAYVPQMVALLVIFAVGPIFVIIASWLLTRMGFFGGFMRMFLFLTWFVLFIKVLLDMKELADFLNAKLMTRLRKDYPEEFLES